MGILDEAALLEAADTAEVQVSEEKPAEKPADEKTATPPVKVEEEDDEKDEKGKKKDREQEEEDEEEDSEEEVEKEKEPEIKDTHKVKLKGGEEVTIEELKKGYMRQADYSKKRAEEAQRVREAEGKAAAFEGERKQIRSYLDKLFKDPEFMRDELEHRAGEAYQKMLYSVGEEALQLEQLDPEAQRIFRENQEMKRQQRRDGRDAQSRKAQEEAAAAEKRRKEMMTNYNKWIPEAMEESKLYIKGDDDHNKEMFGLVKARIVSDYGQRDYTEDEIKAAAHAVAESRPVKALMAGRGEADPSELEKLIGPENVKKLLKYQADKARGKEEPPPPKKGPVPPKKKKGKEPAGLGSFFNDLRDREGI